MLLKLNGLSFLLTTDCVGGVFTQTLSLASDLVRRGADVIIVTLGPQPSADQISDMLTTGAEWLAIRGVLDWMAGTEDEVRETAQLIENLARKRRITSVHLHAPAYAAFGFNYPHIAACHSCQGTWWSAVYPNTPLPHELVWRSQLTGLGLTRAEDIIAPSHSFAAKLAAFYQLERMPIAAPNGLHYPIHISLMKRSGAIAIGRFWDKAKNIEGLMKIAKGLTQTLHIIGPFDVSGSILQNNVHLHGPQTRASTAEHFLKSNVFISAALYEPFGLAVLEAAQAGLALVLSDIPAHRENWDGAAIFVGPSDYTHFARAINHLCAHPEEAEERGRSAQQRAKHFTSERMGETTALTHLNPRNRRVAA